MEQRQQQLISAGDSISNNSNLGSLGKLAATARKRSASLSPIFPFLLISLNRWRLHWSVNNQSHPFSASELPIFPLFSSLFSVHRKKTCTVYVATPTPTWWLYPKIRWRCNSAALKYHSIIFKFQMSFHIHKLSTNLSDHHCKNREKDLFLASGESERKQVNHGKRHAAAVLYCCHPQWVFVYTTTNWRH